jgi:hypothetical protein
VNPDTLTVILVMTCAALLGYAVGRVLAHLI